MIDAATVIADALRASRSACVTCSFQAEDVVLVWMLRQVQPDIPVLFLDTVHHFAETYEYRDAMTRRWNLRLVNLRAAEPSPGEWVSNTDACCARHKVAPLFAALAAYDTWFTGLRRDQSPSRAQLEVTADFTLPGGRVIRKVSPLAAWSTKAVWDHARRHDIPLLSLYDAGYASIGCEPCTTRPVDPADPRSGRWQGRKLECGIHVAATAPASGDPPSSET